MASQRVNPVIHESWKSVLIEEFTADYFLQLKDYLKQEKASETIYPAGGQIFSAFDHTPFEETKVVILGQDPYHGEGQAHGLSFSVPDNIKQPPSLVNIFKELKEDLGYEIPKTGNLSSWAKQGVLLLNAVLTVRAGKPGSHQKKGWELFTDQVIKKISENKMTVIFLLWGKYAQAKEELIDLSKHHVLKAAHPSPYSATYGFFGCRHFSAVNELLKREGLGQINWNLN